MCLLLDSQNELSMPYHTPVNIVDGFCTSCYCCTKIFTLEYVNAIQTPIVAIPSFPWNEMYHKKRTAKQINKKTALNRHILNVSLKRLLVVRKLWANIHTLNWKNVANVAIGYLFLSPVWASPTFTRVCTRFFTPLLFHFARSV